MSALVGFLLVAIAAITVGGVLFIVMQEKHDHEEHYLPGQTPELPNPDQQPGQGA
ncbi:MAG: hypothetical protein SF162_16515 [bacterium]|nr:hypothetical protein [bacterium]